MNVSRHDDGAGAVRLALAGELELSTVDQLREHVTREFGTVQRPQQLVIDMAAVTFCDSTGLAALIDARATAADHHADFSVINPSRMTRTIMQVTGLLELLTGADEPCPL
ncbi:anti-anti-sigma factor [Krasilnikovia cinnamomea]|uniref:Anti-sigma factor antagonist n=1 Tax=Krasilnikovia cinnamomea TaxID=349313 RepID=A0A4Q7ZJT9_9ACTN|nr:STAS domain-containing protein [Krasilnikovia cinnamomea]RZU51172.1 anti-anti-sigma factor [Krasilnikovia cinnamomea]